MMERAAPTEHDPGPWTENDGAIVAPASGQIIAWAYAKSTCGRGDDFYGCRTHSANSTLRWRSPADLAVALAAPDLLAALNGMLAPWVRLDDAELAHWIKRHGLENVVTAEMIIAGRAAMAKALVCKGEGE